MNEQPETGLLVVAANNLSDLVGRANFDALSQAPETGKSQLPGAKTKIINVNKAVNSVSNPS